MKLSSGAIETRRPPASLTSIIKTAATALALPFDTAGGVDAPTAARTRTQRSAKPQQFIGQNWLTNRVFKSFNHQSAATSSISSRKSSPSHGATGIGIGHYNTQPPIKSPIASKRVGNDRIRCWLRRSASAGELFWWRDHRHPEQVGFSGLQQAGMHRGGPDRRMTTVDIGAP